jgi:uncharacterized protein YqiB (DUF1249 family)
VLFRRAAAKDRPGFVFGSGHLPGCVLWFSLSLSSSGLFLRVAAASIVGRVGFLSVHHLAVATMPALMLRLFFRAFSVQVAATTSHTSGRLDAIWKYMAKLLAVVTLRQAILVFVRLHLDRYVAEACQSENILRLLSPG